MGESQIVRCPYCHETCEVWIDIDLEGSFVQDCEVCCRPWVLYVQRNDEGDVHVDVTRAQ
ncbi:MAG: CPXCG motif-containing cysteine-rich protein [Deltaproteobacteria bacterium]|nr:CPXCG motif-containing cysteine-rich protein [Deltaproteobacteria bacterium]